MAAPLLAEFLGGTPFLGFIAAVAFATILAVVAGLTLSGAAALSHDLWVSVVRKEKAGSAEQLKVARIATVGLGIVGVLLGITFKGQNVAFMVGLAFAIAASANFPALVLSIFWRRYTTAGAVTSMVLGTVSTLVLIYLSPTVQVDILKHPAAWFPIREPGAGHDAAVVPLGNPGVAPHRQSRGGGGIRRRRAADAPGPGTLLTPRIRPAIPRSFPVPPEPPDSPARRGPPVKDRACLSPH